MYSLKSQSFSSDIATLHYRPNDRRRNAIVVTSKHPPEPVATHLPASMMYGRTEADLNTWLRYAVSGTPLVLHLTGKEQLDCARRIAWFVETCRRFDVDLDVSADIATHDALELLHALGADMIKFDATLARDWRGRALMRRVRTMAAALHMAA